LVGVSKFTLNVADEIVLEQAGVGAREIRANSVHVNSDVLEERLVHVLSATWFAADVDRGWMGEIVELLIECGQ